MRKGFTLIELLVVVVVIGVLAAIAAPRYLNSKRLAYISAMKSDLRNIVSSAESKFAEDGTYQNYQATQSSGDVVLSFTGSKDGWEATATHVAVPGTICRVERGPAAGTATEPVCQ